MLKAVRKHIPCFFPLCASQFVRHGTAAVIQERDGNGNKSELHYSVVKGVWQGSTLSSATFCWTLWSKMPELLERTNSVRPVMGFISYADDFAVSSDDDEAADMVNFQQQFRQGMADVMQQVRNELNETVRDSVDRHRLSIAQSISKSNSKAVSNQCLHPKKLGRQ